MLSNVSPSAVAIAPCPGLPICRVQSFFIPRYCHHRHLHSFPTRRSSDLLEDFEVELGVNVVEQKDRRLLETAPEKLQFRELQKHHDHLLFAAGKHFLRGTAAGRELDV